MAEILKITTDEFIRDFACGISDARFKPFYRIQSRNGGSIQEREKLDAIAIYMWNIALCQSLYPTLHLVEVVFRNALHNALTIEKGSPLWYTDPFLLDVKEQERVQEAQFELRSAKKMDVPVRVVAELTFGFWVTLYSDKYLQKICHPTIQYVFPNLHPKMRKHETVQKRLQEVRALRNRVFHHEPIWHWNDLNQKYNDTLQMIQWINRVALKVHCEVDCFKQVHQDGWYPYRKKLDRMLEDTALQRMLEDDVIAKKPVASKTA